MSTPRRPVGSSLSDPYATGSGQTYSSTPFDPFDLPEESFEEDSDDHPSSLEEMGTQFSSTYDSRELPPSEHPTVDGYDAVPDTTPPPRPSSSGEGLKFSPLRSLRKRDDET